MKFIKKKRSFKLILKNEVPFSYCRFLLDSWIVTDNATFFLVSATFLDPQQSVLIPKLLLVVVKN